MKWFADSGLILWDIQTACLFIGVQLLPITCLAFQLRYQYWLQRMYPHSLSLSRSLSLTHSRFP